MSKNNNKIANRIINLSRDHTFYETAKILGMKTSSLKRRLREIRQYQMVKVEFKREPNTEDSIITKSTVDERKDIMTLDGNISSKHHDRVKVLEDFLALHEVNMDEWEVTRVIYGASDVTMSGNKSSTNEDATYTNYNIKVFLKPKDKKFDDTAFVDQLTAIISRSNWNPPQIKTSPIKKENLLVLTINDLHLGRMSWAEETGANYDSKIAASHMRKGLEDILSKAEGHGISEILYYVGHDFFTYDSATPFPATTHGTPQEADSRWQKMFMNGVELQINAIKMLSQIAPVTVQEISGNHDQQASFYMGQVLKIFFRNYSNVTMDISPKPRQYFRFGECLIGAGHGKKERPVDLQAVMLAESRKDMGDTKYWYFVLGHKHHYEERRRRVLKVPTNTDSTLHGLRNYEEVDEDYKGLTITYLPNLAEQDDYETESCFVGSIKSCVGQIYSPTKGRIATLQYNL